MKLFLSCLLSLGLFSNLFSQETETTADCQWLREHLMTVKDFPKPGFSFITYVDLLKKPDSFKRAIQTLAKRYRDQNIDVIVGLDARGFIFGTALAYELNLPFVMVRKAGKLPRKTHRIDYTLEYGTASFEIEVESINAGDRVVIVDDVLASGGTANAAATLVEGLGGEVVETAFLVEFTFLNGRERLARPVYSLITLFDGL